MHVFRSETQLAADPATVFAFHENPHNIKKISPFFLQVVQVQADSVAVKDDTFTLNLRIFGFPLSWVGAWASVEKPVRLVDTASLFPFQTWHHEHRFEGNGAGARMIDTVTYKLPFGIIGRLFGATLFRLQLILMFAGRHRATRRYFENLRAPHSSFR